MTASSKSTFDIDHLLHPTGAFGTPMDVVADPDLTHYEKRAILASWASDVCAAEAAPDLHGPPAGAVIGFDDIMEALKHLDGQAGDKPHYGKLMGRAQRWKDLYRRGDRRSGPLAG